MHRFQPFAGRWSVGSGQPVDGPEPFGMKSNDLDPDLRHTNTCSQNDRMEPAPVARACALS